MKTIRITEPDQTITPETHPITEETCFIFNSEEGGSITVAGDFGFPAHAMRKGDGSGDAVRDFGRGDAVRAGHGDGNAVRRGYGRGDAWRWHTGDGNALRIFGGRGRAYHPGWGGGFSFTKMAKTYRGEPW